MKILPLISKNPARGRVYYINNTWRAVKLIHIALAPPLNHFLIFQVQL
jgi:hypothetical protein